VLEEGVRRVCAVHALVCARSQDHLSILFDHGDDVEEWWGFWKGGDDMALLLQPRSARRGRSVICKFPRSAHMRTCDH
jgi:hypothetical protein